MLKYDTVIKRSATHRCSGMVLSAVQACLMPVRSGCEHWGTALCVPSTTTYALRCALSAFYHHMFRFLNLVIAAGAI